MDGVDQVRNEKTCKDRAEKIEKRHCWCRPGETVNVDGRKVEIRCNLDWMQ